MTYDFWDTMKKFLKGELKVGDGKSSVTVKSTMNPAEAIGNIQKIASLKNQAKPQQTATAQQNSAGIKQPMQAKAPSRGVCRACTKKYYGYGVQQSRKNANNEISQLDNGTNIITKINPVLKNIEDMVSNAKKKNQTGLNTKAININQGTNLRKLNSDDGYAGGGHGGGGGNAIPDYTKELTAFISDSLAEIRSPGFDFKYWYDNVNHNGIWDSKKEEVWRNTIEDKYGIPFPGKNNSFYFNGQLMTPEQFGNFFYGITGSDVLNKEKDIQTIINSADNILKNSFSIITKQPTIPVKPEESNEALIRLGSIIKQLQKDGINLPTILNEVKDQEIIGNGMEYYKNNYKKGYVTTNS